MQAVEPIGGDEQQKTVRRDGRATPAGQTRQQRLFQQARQMEIQGRGSDPLHQLNRLLPVLAVDTHLVPVDRWSCGQAEGRDDAVGAVGVIQGLRIHLAELMALSIGT